MPYTHLKYFSCNRALVTLSNFLIPYLLTSSAVLIPPQQTRHTAEYRTYTLDALIKEKQFENAKAVLEQAKNQGMAEEKLNVLIV